MEKDGKMWKEGVGSGGQSIVRGACPSDLDSPSSKQTEIFPDFPILILGDSCSALGKFSW